MKNTLILLLAFALACTSKNKELTLQEKLDLIHRDAAQVNPFETYADELIEVDCSQVDQMLSDIYEADQEVRNTGELMKETDRANLIEVLSILKYCGMPKTSELSSHKSRNAIPMVLQHQTNQSISSYFLPLLKKGATSGLISPEIWVRIVDRQLMHNGYLQVFGTNFINGQLYELEHPEKIQQRRDSAGLRPFEDILDGYGLTLDEALANQFSSKDL